MPDKSNDSRSILVVGAGIVGAATAYRMASSGWSVDLVDAVSPAAGASGGSWAWINAISARSDPAYFSFRRAAIAAWHDWDQEFGGALPIDWTGTLLWEADMLTDEPILPAKLLDADGIQAAEPLIATPPEKALSSPDDGLVDGLATVQIFLQAAVAAGARLHFGRSAHTLIRDGDTVRGIETNYGKLEAAETLIAAGTGSASLLSEVGLTLPTRPKPGLLVITQPVEARMQCAFWSDHIHVKQMRDGRLMIGESQHQPGALDNPAATADGMLRAAEKLMPDLGPLSIAKTTIAARPIPEDGLPVVGRLPGLSGLTLATMHSGMTLAPLVAELLKELFVNNRVAALLDPFQPERLIRRSKEG